MAIDITAVGGSGTHTLQKVNVNLEENFIYFPNRDEATAYPTTITDDTAWVFRETTGAIDGVADETVYFTISDGFSIKFSDTAGGTAIDLTEYAAGTVTFNFPFVYQNQFNISSVTFADQQAVRYLTDGDPVTGLTSGNIYYVKNLLTGLGGSSLYNFTDHTFTTGGATGQFGPTISSLKTEYSAGGADWVTDYLAQGTYQGYQDWTVPTDGIYEFTVKGAPGRQGQALGGGGAIVRGRVRLNKGEIITVAVGQRGELPTNNFTWPASSGGTFVVRKAGNIPLFVAGGGSSSGSTNAGLNAVLNSFFGGTSSTGYVGGANGFGAGGISTGGAGGGFYSAGGNSERGGGGGGFNNGLIGGYRAGGSSAVGGFGGGAGSDGESWGGSGGAGGYGGGATNSRSGSSRGGGGGSYIFPTATDVATSTGQYNNQTTLLGRPITNLGAYNIGAVEGEVSVELVESSVYGFTLHETADDAANDVEAIVVSAAGNSYHALVPLVVDTVGEVINLTSPHGLFDGQALNYFYTGTNPVGDLNESTVYYVEYIDDYSFKLSLTPDPSFTTVNLTAPSNAESEGFSVVIVNVDTNSFTIANHGFLVNQPVRYDNGGGENISPLQDNATYYVKEVIDANRFTLSQSLNGPEINLTSAGTGTSHSFIFTVLNLNEDTIYLPNHGYVSGQTVRYAKSRDLDIVDVEIGGQYRYITTSENHGYSVNQRPTFDNFKRPSISTPTLNITEYSSSGTTRRITTDSSHNILSGYWITVEGFTGTEDSRFNHPAALVTSTPSSNQIEYVMEESVSISTTAIDGPTVVRNSEWDYVTHTRKLKIRRAYSSGTTRYIETEKTHNLPSGYLMVIEGITGDYADYLNGQFYISVNNNNLFNYTGTYTGSENKEDSIVFDISTTDMEAYVYQIPIIDSITSSNRYRYYLPQSNRSQAREYTATGKTSLVGMYLTGRSLINRTLARFYVQAPHLLSVGDNITVPTFFGAGFNGYNRDTFTGDFQVSEVINSTQFYAAIEPRQIAIENVRLFSNTVAYINTVEPHNMTNANYFYVKDIDAADNAFWSNETTIINRWATSTTRYIRTDNPHYISNGDRIRIVSMTGDDTEYFVGDYTCNGVQSATQFTYVAPDSVAVVELPSNGTITGTVRRAEYLDTVPSYSVTNRNRVGTLCDVTLNTTHSFQVGEKVRIANISNVSPEVFNGTHVITGVPATNRIQFQSSTSGTITAVGVSGTCVGSHQIRYNIPTYQRTLSSRELISHTVALYQTSYDHGFEVGTTITVSSISGANPNIFNGTYVVSSVPSSRTFTVTRTPQANVTTFTVTSRNRAVNVCDVTLNTTHNLLAGNTITISGMSGTDADVFNGTHVISSIPASNRIQFFSSTSGTISTASVSGSLQVAGVSSANVSGTITLNTIPKIDKVGNLELAEVAYAGYVGHLDVNTEIEGLENQNTYYIQRLDDNIVRLYNDPTLTDAPDITGVGIGNQQIVTTSVDYDEDTLTIPNHGFSLGELVEYDTGGEDPISGLTTATPYYVIPIDGNTIKLATSSINATNGVAIDLQTSPVPTGRHSLKSLIRTPDGTYEIDTVPSTTTFEVTAGGTVPEIVKSFDPRFTVDLDQNIIKVVSHGFLTGTKITYGNGGGTDLGGLVDDSDYYVITINKDYLRLATTAENAASGVPISLTTFGAGSAHTLTSFQLNGQITGVGTVSTEVDSVLVNGSGTNFSKILKVGDNFRLFPPDVETSAYFESTDVDTSTDQILVASHPFVTGNSVLFSPGTGGRRQRISRLQTSGTTRYIYTGENHGYTNGQVVTISDLPDDYVEDFEGTFTITYVSGREFRYLASESVTFGITNIEQGIAQTAGSDGVAPSPLVEDYYYYVRRVPDETVLNITNRNVTSGIATITTSTNHNYQVGNVITIADITGVNPEVFNGTHTIVGLPSATTFEFHVVSANIGATAVTGTCTTSSSNLMSLHALKTEAVAGTNAIDFSTQGSGSAMRVRRLVPTAPIVRKISAIGSDEQITVNRSYQTAYENIAYSYPTFLYVRPQGYSLHRPFDGGVEMSTGTGTWYGSMIRQTRKYFRYQSGKGIQTSAAVNFKPSIDIESAYQIGDSNVIQMRTRRPHGLIDGLFVRVDEAFDSNGAVSQVYNGTFQVSVIDSFNISMIANNPVTEPQAYGYPRLHVDAWTNGALRAGMFDFQNGMFYEFDGQKLYAVRRSSTQQIAGTMAALQGSEFVFGTNTAFTSQLTAGDSIVMRGQTYKVASIINDSRITIKPEYKGSSGIEREFDPSAVVNVSTDVFQINGHGYTQNLPIVYNSIDGNPIGGLVNGRTYYVEVLTSNTFKLKASPDSLTFVNLSDAGTGTPHSFTPAKTGIIATLTVDTKIPQEEWSIDPCDGTGPTGYELNLSKIQMVYMDYSWYGAGKIRFGFKTTDGQVQYTHEFVHNNNQFESYFRSGNLPARYEVTTFDNPTYIPSLFHWGTSVIMDGRFDDDKAYLFTKSSQTLNIGGTTSKTFGSTALDPAQDFINIPSHGFASGNAVQFIGIGSTGLPQANNQNPATRSISPWNPYTNLVNENTYYIKALDTNNIALCGREADAIAASPTIATRVKSNYLVTITTTAAHGFTSGDWVLVYIPTTDSASRAFNGVARITVTNATTFTYYQYSFARSVGSATITALGAICHENVIDFFNSGNTQSTYKLSPQGSLNNTSGTNYQPLLSLRLSPSVSEGLTGKLGDRDIINRMQLRLNEIGVQTNQLVDVKLLLNGRLNNLNFVGVDTPSLVQTVEHTSNDTISGGIQVYNFKASGNQGDESTTTVDVGDLFELSNSILGGDSVFPDGPDIITIAVARLTGQETLASAKMSWSEAQA